MIEQTVLVVNKLGLHARAAAKLVKLTGGYKSKITIDKNGTSVDAKSIMGIMMLAAAQGSELKLTADGEDELEAMEAVQQLFSDYFGEGE
ncbi:MAG: HPr family phosphocarrier protein [Pseudomonadota bacterium]